jgi:hypothetical protein
MPSWKRLGGRGYRSAFVSKIATQITGTPLKKSPTHIVTKPLNANWRGIPGPADGKRFAVKVIRICKQLNA